MTRDSLPWTTIQSIAAPTAQQEIREIATQQPVLLQRMKIAANGSNAILERILSGTPYDIVEINWIEDAVRQWAVWLQETLNTTFPLINNKSFTFPLRAGRGGALEWRAKRAIHLASYSLIADWWCLWAIQIQKTSRSSKRNKTRRNPATRKNPRLRPRRVPARKSNRGFQPGRLHTVKIKTPRLRA